VTTSTVGPALATTGLLVYYVKFVDALYTGGEREPDPDPRQELRQVDGTPVEEQVHERLRARREDRDILTAGRPDG